MRPITPPSNACATADAWKSALSDLPTGTRLQRRSGGPARKRSIAGSSARRTGFTEKEVDFYLDLDFVNQVALVAELEEAGRR